MAASNNGYDPSGHYETLGDMEACKLANESILLVLLVTDTASLPSKT